MRDQASQRTKNYLSQVNIDLPFYTAVSTGLENIRFHFSPKEQQCQKMFKLPHSCTHLTLYQSNAQSLQVWLQQHVNKELPDVLAGFRKREESEIILPT